MSQKQYDLLVFIGRFQPFHCGHKRVVDRALELADNVLILVGGRNQNRSIRNPWTFEEREAMIASVYSETFKPSWEESRSPINIKPIDDHTYNDDAWVKQVQETITDASIEIFGKKNQTWRDYEAQQTLKIGLIGCNKDNSSYYLKLFPNYHSEEVEFLVPLNATDIRKKMFEAPSWSVHEAADNVLPLPIAQRLLDFDQDPFMPVDVWNRLEEQYDELEAYRAKWGKGPFLTADSLVECGGHILVVERGGTFGRGMLALPGGFIELDETFQDAAIRELREETRLKVPEPVLRGSIQQTRVFDNPHRSDRGRIVTQCFHIDLKNELTLPIVKGSDDAAKAFWLPVSEINENSFFEDHAFIIRKLLGI